MSRRFLRSWLRPFATNPLEDGLAATLAVGGFALLALTLWLAGGAGVGFDRRPDLGGYGWLLVGLLLLATVFSARWANRRVVEQGGRAAFLWLRVRRPVDDGHGDEAHDRPDDMPILIQALGGGAGGATLGNLWTSGYYFDTSPIPWLVAGALLAASLVWIIWVHRRVLARPASTCGVEYIRDLPAKVAATASSLFLVLAVGTAGLAGIPMAVGDSTLALAIALPIVLVLALVCIRASMARTRHVADAQASTSRQAEPAQRPSE